MTKDVIVVNVDQSLEDVLRIFSENHISGAPVVKNDRVIGIISESDLVKKLGLKHLFFYTNQAELERIKRLLSKGVLTVEKIMKKEVYTIQEDENVAESARMMNTADVNRLPVINSEGKLVGIITRGDIIRVFARSLGTQVLIERKEPMVLETDVDKILQIIEERGSIDFNELAKQLNVSVEKIEEWGKILEEHGLVLIDYPPIGKPLIKTVKKEG